MRVRTASLSDLDAVLALEIEAFPEPSRWSTESWREELCGPNRHAVVCDEGGVVVGVATFSHSDDVADLNRIIVTQAHRGERRASALILAGLAWARERGVTRMLLEVAHDNAPAIAAYRRHGFLEIARRRDYYAPGTDALVMEVTHV